MEGSKDRKETSPQMHVQKPTVDPRLSAEQEICLSTIPLSSRKVLRLRNGKGFGQRIFLPEPSPHLKSPVSFAGDYVEEKVALRLIGRDVRKFKPMGKPVPNNLHMKLAIARATLAFRLPKEVKLYHINDIFSMEDLPIWCSSPGLPWIHLGYKTVGDVRENPEAVKSIRYFWHRVKLGELPKSNDCCAFVRAGDVKCRAVWGYPATMMVGEAVFALPLIKAYSQNETPVCYGYETGVGEMSLLVQTMRGHHYLGIDFESFEKTVPEWLIRVAFDILLLNLDVLYYENYGVTVVVAILRMWDYIIDYFINTPIRLWSGTRYRKRGGIATGSYFAQLIGSIVNYILLMYVSLKEDNRMLSCKVFGGNSISGFERAIYPGDVRKHIEPLGFRINTEKSSSSSYLSDLTFLGFKLNIQKGQKES